jgi:hypothetical protein
LAATAPGSSLVCCSRLSLLGSICLCRLVVQQLGVLQHGNALLQAFVFCLQLLHFLTHHSLLRVIRQSGDWLEAESDGVDGFIYAPYTVAGSRDELTQEDFALGYAALGQKFDEQKAEERLGAVKQEKIDKKRKQINYTFEGAVISVARKKQAVEAIRVVDPKYITMRGVSIGDSAGRAVGQYGLPDAVVYAADNTTYEYFWEDDKEQPLRFALEIDKQSRVTAFILEKLKEK